MQFATRVKIAAVILMVGFQTPAFAQSKKAKAEAQAPAASTAPAAQAGTAPANPDKVDVTDIEQKYWASKDTDFSVVQNRLYPKAKRYSLSLVAGPVVADPNSSGGFYALDASYYFSERWGMAATYGIADLQDNKTVESLVEAHGVRPDHNKIKQFWGVSGLWVPIYAKASFLNSKIVYFDFAVSPGIGVQQYVQQLDVGNVTKTTPALTIDFTQQFFFSNHFALRADYRHRLYRAEIQGWHIQSGQSTRSSHTDTQHDQILTFGFTFFF